MIDTKYKVRISSVSWRSNADFIKDGIHYSCDVPLDEADGLIVLYDPSEELLEFSRSKVWYTYEPQWHSHYRKHPIGKKLVKSLKNSEWLYYANPDKNYRVPHITVADNITKPRCESINSQSVAVVSNFGGKLWFLKPHIILRNRMILCPLVDLYGRESAWVNFRHFPNIWQIGIPDNYVKEISGGHLDNDFIEFLSSYKVCVCLENSSEPYYFTEKFVNAVRAGCIPIYHAHPTIKNTFLKSAKWIDPKDFNFNPQKTIQFALNQDISVFREINDAWLESGVLNAMNHYGFWQKICSIMKYKLEHQQ